MSIVWLKKLLTAITHPQARSKYLLDVKSKQATVLLYSSFTITRGH
jgi:hypothetical protein